MSSPGQASGELLLDLGLPVALRCPDPVLRKLLERELGGFAWTRALPPAPAIEVETAPLRDEVVDGSMETRPGGWALTTWGVRMEVVLGSPTRITMEVSTRAGLSAHLALQDALYLAAPWHGALLLHAAGLDWGGRALVISGDKDAGKTTSCRTAPAQVRVLSDEGIVCMPGDEGWTAHATPFHSDEFSFAPAPGPRPLTTLVHLVRGEPSLEPLGPGDALWPLMRASGRLGGPSGPHLLALMARLVEEVPVHLLCSDDPDQVWPMLAGIR